MNLIVLREPLTKERNRLKPIGASETIQTDHKHMRYLKDKPIIEGGEWWSDISDDRIVVKM